MTEYLFPYNDEVKIDETQRIFAIKKRAEWQIPLAISLNLNNNLSSAKFSDFEKPKQI